MRTFGTELAVRFVMRTVGAASFCHGKDQFPLCGSDIIPGSTTDTCPSALENCLDLLRVCLDPFTRCGDGLGRVFGVQRTTQCPRLFRVFRTSGSLFFRTYYSCFRRFLASNTLGAMPGFIAANCRPSSFLIGRQFFRSHGRHGCLLLGKDLCTTLWVGAHVLGMALGTDFFGRSRVWHTHLQPGEGAGLQWVGTRLARAS